MCDDHRSRLGFTLFQIAVDELKRLPVRQRIGSVADVCGSGEFLCVLYGGRRFVEAQCCMPFYRSLVAHIVDGWCIEDKGKIHKEPHASLRSFTKAFRRINLYVDKDGVLTPGGEALVAFYTIKDL